jgi:hypothetical protein
MQLRLQTGKTQWRLAADAAMHPSHVCALEGGRETPRPDSVVLVRLARALDYQGDPADLLAEVETANVATS